mmetsp:Transcript_18745/g.21546  ORF Transcript_18745/g.21546 Transcript_18745/m.21546 type:complete len:218 (+) Transcript_18745:554-1207(+)
MNDEKFKFKMDKKFYSPNIFLRIWFAIITPFVIGGTLRTFKSFRTDPQSEKIRELKAKDDFKNYYCASKEIPFEDIRKCYKQYEKTTFNDYILGALSISMHKWYTNNGVKDPKKILTLIPINNRPFPKNLDDLKLNNTTTAFKFELPINADIREILKTNKTTFSRFMNITYLSCIGNLGTAVPYLPEFLAHHLFLDYYRGVDLLFSNVPFSTEPWYF